MRAPCWIREFVPDLPDDVTGRQVAERIIAAGLEVETVDSARARTVRTAGDRPGAVHRGAARDRRS